MKLHWLLGLCLTLVLQVRALSVEPMARVRTGALRGSKMLSSGGRPFVAFRSIPYAQAPVGALRFQDPVPALPWDGVFDASEDGPACLQLEGNNGELRGSEDCLRLNVYTHDVDPEGKKRPVMVYIHGGSWTSGSGYGDTDVYGPNNYMDRDIVLVTMNYRLSTLGFFSTEDEVAPGNYGLLDQALALRWVKENIANFGGDAQQVTLFGQSSGAAAVHTHMLSPHSAGLFQRAIAQSGSALCPWCMQKYVGRYSRMLAKHLQCPTESSVQLVECLRGKDAKDIIKFRKVIEVSDSIPVAFGPRIDAERADPFLPKDPVAIIESGSFNQVPLIAGVNANEGAFAIARLAGKSPEQVKLFEKQPDTLMKYMLGIEFDADASSKSLSIFKSYFGNRTDVTLNSLEEMISDGMFFKCVVDAIDLHSKFSKAPVFAYFYAHRGLFTFPMLFLSDDNNVEFGVSHGDEILLQFSVPFLPPLILPNDIKMQAILADLWTSFAATGTPSSSADAVKWQPLTADRKEYLKFGDNSATVVTGDYPFVGRLSRWSADNRTLPL